MVSRRLKVLVGNFISLFVLPKKNRVTFVTKSRVPFVGNLRVLADLMLSDSDSEVLIYADGHFDAETQRTLEAAGARVLCGFGLRNLIAILRSSTMIVSHSIRDAHISRRRSGRRVVNVWHGVPIKRIELLMLQQSGTTVAPTRLRQMWENARVYDFVLACNPYDKVVMGEAFGVPPEKVLVNGLPRFDYLKPNYQFPPDLDAAFARLTEAAKGRRIITYAPTFREAGNSPFRWFDEAILASLRSVALDLNIVFALRPHPYDHAHLQEVLADGKDVLIDGSSLNCAEPAVLLRMSDALITDYSSIWIDYLLLERPIIGLVPDMQHYLTVERGFTYDLPTVFPGPLAHSWLEAIALLRQFLSSDGLEQWRRAYLVEISSSSEQFLPEQSTINYSASFLAKLLQIPLK